MIVMVMVDDAVLPSHVAETVAVPAVTPVTLPLPSTVATDGALLAHVTARPVSVFPLASDATAASVTLPPITSVTADGSTASDATGTGDTVTTTAADLPPELAAICVDPTALPVTSPLDVTVAIAVSALDQNTVAPATAPPLASSTCAVSDTCPPTFTAGVAGVIVTLAAPPEVPPPGPVESLPEPPHARKPAPAVATAIAASARNPSADRCARNTFNPRRSRIYQVVGFCM
jgi:hypothetical protein